MRSSSIAEQQLVVGKCKRHSICCCTIIASVRPFTIHELIHWPMRWRPCDVNTERGHVVAVKAARGIESHARTRIHYSGLTFFQMKFTAAKILSQTHTEICKIVEWKIIWRNGIGIHTEKKRRREKGKISTRICCYCLLKVNSLEF